MRDRLSTKSNALLQAEIYQYDAAGNLAFFTDRKGQVSGFNYDLLGRALLRPKTGPPPSQEAT